MYAPRSTSGNFIYNSMLASALAQLLPAQERQIIRKWIDTLLDVDDNQIQIRNEYMWFLLLTLQNRRVVMPFNKMPEVGELVPLKDLLPKHVYNDVVNKSVGQANLAWVDQVMSRGSGADEGSQEQPGSVSTPPSQFLQNQPKPQRGVICYMGAFSDQQT